MLKTTWSRRLPMYLPTSDFFAHLFGCFHAHRWQEAEENRLSIAPWNHERCAIFFVPPVGRFPALGRVARVTVGFDAQTPATIQYDHLAAPLFQHRYICLELRLFGAEILDLVKLPRQRSIRGQTYAHQPPAATATHFHANHCPAFLSALSV